MGNRAIITNKDKKIGIYLHWNGGRDSVEAFLQYCKLKGVRSPESDVSYSFARLTQIVSNYFGGNLSIGLVSDCSDVGMIDNGIYIVGKDWKIIDREYPYKNFKEQNETELKEMLMEIDEAQPDKQKIGDMIFSKEKYTQNIKKGDMVYIEGYGGEYEKVEVKGFGNDENINGTNVFNKPYVDRFNDSKHCKENINNYILGDKVRVDTTNSVCLNNEFGENEF